MNEQADMLLLEIEEKMEKAVLALDHQFSSIRTGRANPSLLDRITVNYYGVETPLKQVAAISVPEAQQLYIKPFDKSILKDIEHAINTSSLELPPRNDGVGIRLMLPPLTEERRRQLVKEVEKLSETGKIAVRNVRRDGNDDLKKLGLPEDSEKGYLEDVQALTDKYIKVIDEHTKSKSDELLTI
ncbi:ribosome recycling factor [Acholeplasma equirhinis]|uniref:ribosome recycling factor n=1 Tax=Acholeplasma equirhinis TaxID=555393 RepID=UPI00197AF6AA|nr:ribosome recycling factor [Acholeplasma equirhinis]MBN3491206.1 ribosome recycling factor [Acholeplasma equirhinis]